jgi:hypothetical protein
MKKTDEKLSEILGIEPIESYEIDKTEVIPAKTQADDDADFARQNIRELIEKGSVAFDNLLHVAKESEHPRAYEVAAGFFKNLSDLNKDLLEIQKRKNDLDPEKKAAKNMNIDKAVFVGSTTELVKFLKNNKQEN